MMHRVLKWRRAGRGVSGYIKKVAPGAFLQEFCFRPSSIGAICPSSRFLARHMARQVPDPRAQTGLIVELGAGTGVITQALLDHGVAPDRLMVVEFSAAFVQRLRARFPDVNVVHGNAADLCQIVPQGVPVSAIISSLPLCSLPVPIMQAILQQWQYLLQDDGIAVQFTYNLRRPAWRNYIHGHETNSKIVWANLPPAKLSTFSFKTAKLASPSPHHENPQSNR